MVDAPPGFYDFSLDKLIECYRHETYVEQASKNNGYVQGEWAKDLTVVQWAEAKKAISASLSVSPPQINGGLKKHLKML